MKRTFGLALLSLALLALILPLELIAQDLHPTRRPSPMALARISLDDAYVSVTYSRPYKRGRDNIFGTKESEALVPYGEVWRTGANEATQLTTTGDLMIGDQTLPAGTYSVFTTPGAEQWTVHFNSRLGMSGTMYQNPETNEYEPGFDPDLNVVNVTVPAGETDEEVDQFTISFEEDGDGGAHMVLQWINTEVRVPFKTAG